MASATPIASMRVNGFAFLAMVMTWGTAAWGTQGKVTQARQPRQLREFLHSVQGRHPQLDCRTLWHIRLVAVAGQPHQQPEPHLCRSGLAR